LAKTENHTVKECGLDRSVRIEIWVLVLVLAQAKPAQPGEYGLDFHVMFGPTFMTFIILSVLLCK
jgi:hypothetical protein